MQVIRRVVGRLMIVAVAIVLAGITVAAWKSSMTVPDEESVEVAPPMRSEFVAVPHPTDADTRRKAMYVARTLGLPLIADANVKAVEVRGFK